MLDLATFYFLLNISIQFRFGTFNLSEIQISRNNAKTDIYIYIYTFAGITSCRTSKKRSVDYILKATDWVEG